MVRELLLFAVALTSACANGDLNDESAAGKADALLQQPIVSCESSRMPQNGERCDPTTVAPAAYCRLGSCTTQCTDECFCLPGGRWECRLFCRDSFGCGKPPLCGVDCPLPDAATGMDTSVADTEPATDAP